MKVISSAEMSQYKDSSSEYIYQWKSLFDSIKTHAYKREVEFKSSSPEIHARLKYVRKFAPPSHSLDEKLILSTLELWLPLKEAHLHSKNNYSESEWRQTKNELKDLFRTIYGFAPPSNRTSYDKMRGCPLASMVSIAIAHEDMALFKDCLDGTLKSYVTLPYGKKTSAVNTAMHKLFAPQATPEGVCTEVQDLPFLDKTALLEQVMEQGTPQMVALLVKSLFVSSPQDDKSLQYAVIEKSSRLGSLQLLEKLESLLEMDYSKLPPQLFGKLLVNCLLNQDNNENHQEKFMHLANKLHDRLEIAGGDKFKSTFIQEVFKSDLRNPQIFNNKQLVSTLAKEFEQFSDLYLRVACSCFKLTTLPVREIILKSLHQHPENICCLYDTISPQNSSYVKAITRDLFGLLQNKGTSHPHDLTELAGVITTLHQTQPNSLVKEAMQEFISLHAEYESKQGFHSPRKMK